MMDILRGVWKILDFIIPTPLLQSFCQKNLSLLEKAPLGSDYTQNSASYSHLDTGGFLQSLHQRSD